VELIKSESEKKSVDKTESKLEGSQQGQKEYISTKFGFAFKYDKLILNDKLQGNDVVELKHISGDKAVLSITKPDAWQKNPEDYIKMAYKDSGDKIYLRKEFKLGKSPALLAELTRSVMKIKMRIIELAAVKDGYIYSFVVTMDEKNVDDVRKEFDLVINSFRLLDTKVNIEDVWKEKLPSDFPHDVLPLYAVDEIYWVSGDSLKNSRELTVVYDSKEKQEKIFNHFSSVMSGAEGLVKNGTYSISGTKSGYSININIESFQYIDKRRVRIEISPLKVAR
jgi:hypothetical protein